MTDTLVRGCGVVCMSSSPIDEFKPLPDKIYLTPRYTQDVQLGYYDDDFMEHVKSGQIRLRNGVIYTLTRESQDDDVYAITIGHDTLRSPLNSLLDSLDWIVKPDRETLATYLATNGIYPNVEEVIEH